MIGPRVVFCFEQCFAIPPLEPASREFFQKILVVELYCELINSILRHIHI